MAKNSVGKNFLILILALGICLLIGYISGYPELTRTSLGMNTDLHIAGYGYPGLLSGSTPTFTAWYASLTKPVFSPPAWIFSPVWLISFLLMGFTLFLILQSGISQSEVLLGLILFIGQLFFVVTWGWAFFGAHLIFAGLLLIIALVASLLCTVIQIFRFSVYGGMLMVPYLLCAIWFAYMNYGLMSLNHIAFTL